MNENERDKIIKNYVKRKEHNKLYARRYRAEHPERIQANNTRYCIKYLTELGYVVTPPEVKA